MGWREFIGIIFFVAGLLAPSVGKMLDRNFRAAAVALCLLGLAAFYSERVFRRRRFGEPNAGFMNEGDVMDSTVDTHGDHGGGFDSDGDH